MKKNLVRFLVLVFVMYLVKITGPMAANESLYFKGDVGQTTTNIEEAVPYENIQDAYAKQIELGTDWSILTR